MMVVNSWMDDATPAEAHAEMDRFQKTQLPIFEEVIGTDAGAYSNEADTFEPNFQTTFFLTEVRQAERDQEQGWSY